MLSVLNTQPNNIFAVFKLELRKTQNIIPIILHLKLILYLKAVQAGFF